MSNRITMVAGDAKTLEVTLLDDEGAALNISNVASVVLAIGLKEASASVLYKTYTKASVINGVDADGRVDLPLVKADTISVTPKPYRYEIILIESGGSEHTVIEDEFVLKKRLVSA